MKTKIAINGFGRIGRNAFKIAYERSDIEVVAVNDLTDTKTLAHLLKHDTNYGLYQHEVDFDDENIIVQGNKIKVLAEKDPANLPWKDLGVQVVIESTGRFVDPEKAKAHITAGAKKVIISAPAKGDGADTIVIGVNEDKLKTATDVISNASCTTNCITPVAAIIEQNFGIEKAMMTTVHSYTASQAVQDAPNKDLREGRNAAENIVPTTTGASIAAAKALPALEGIFGGMSVRVPTPVVSLSDFAIVTKKPVTVEEVNEVFKKAAADPYYQGILTVSEEPLVSSDYIGDSHSAIVDLALTAVVGGNLLKVVAWYDNEWGYSNRLVEITADTAKLLESTGTEETSAPAPEEPAPTSDSPTMPNFETPAPVASGTPDKDEEEPLLDAPASAHEELLPAAKEPEEAQSHGSDLTMPSFTPDPSSSDSLDAPDTHTPDSGSNTDGFHRF